jgi:hypothetical protein
MQSTIQQVLGSLTGVKQPGCDVDHSPPNSAEVKHEWSIPLLPVCAFMAWKGATSWFLYFAFIYNFLKYQTDNALKTF